MISRTQKYIFIHIPKTGGTSIEHTLFDKRQRILFPENKEELKICREFLYGEDVKPEWRKPHKKFLQHLSAEEMIEDNFLSLKNFKEYFSFAFVRNPWDRAVSEWKWATSKSRWASNEHMHDFSLEQFLDKVTRKRLGPHDMTQCSFIKYKSQQKIVDFVGKFESLQEDFNYICQQIKHPVVTLPRINETTKRKPYQEYYNQDSMDLVEELFKEDIEHFGYEFLKC